MVYIKTNKTISYKDKPVKEDWLNGIYVEIEKVKDTGAVGMRK